MDFANTRQAGHAYEQLVAQAALAKGWKILEQNFQCKLGEIDLICTHGRQLFIIEVRFRHSSQYGRAAATVGYQKQRKIIRTTQYFLKRYPQYQNYAIRFDVVGVDAEHSLDWIEGAFYAY